MLVFLDKVEHVARLATGPALVTLPPGIDVERRVLVVVEGAKTLVSRPHRPQPDVTADYRNDVAGFLDLLRECRPVLLHWTPSHVGWVESSEPTRGSRGIVAAKGPIGGSEVEAHRHPSMG